MIQLDIAVSKDTICIKPYIVYNKEEVKEDFLRVLKLDEELDNILKQNRL